MSQSTLASPQAAHSNATRPILIRSSGAPVVPTINLLDQPEQGSLARPAPLTDFTPGPTLVHSRASLMGKLSGDTLSSVKFRCGANGEISQSKVRSAYMPMAKFTRFPRQEKTREEKRIQSAQRYAIQRWCGTPNLSSAGQILREKLIAATNNNILVAKQALAEQDEREARAQAQADSAADLEAKRAAKEAKRLAELAEQAALLNSLGPTMNPDSVAAHSAHVEDNDDDDAGFPNYAAAYPGENSNGATGEQSESTGEEKASE